MKRVLAALLVAASSAVAAPEWVRTSPALIEAAAGDKVVLYAIPRAGDNPADATTMPIWGGRVTVRYNNKEQVLYYGSDFSTWDGGAETSKATGSVLVEPATGAEVVVEAFTGPGGGIASTDTLWLVRPADRPADLVATGPTGFRNYMSIIATELPTAYNQSFGVRVRVFSSNYTTYTEYAGTAETHIPRGLWSASNGDAANLSPGLVTTFKWQKDGADYAYTAGTTVTQNVVAGLVIPEFNPATHAGLYTATFTNVTTGESITTSTRIVDRAALSSRLSNASVRAPVGTGTQTTIMGLVLAGSGTKSVMLRGVGPGIAQWVSGHAVNPQLTLYTLAGAVVDSNDDWGSGGNAATITTRAAQLGASPLSAGSADAVLLRDLSGGVYTCHLTAGAGDTGIALAELYDAGGGPAIVNVSCRKFVGTGDQVLIAGFVIEGNRPKRLLVRAVGPTLASQNVTGVLADPKLDLYRMAGGTSTLISSNDNWGGSATIADTARTVGAFELPASSTDASLLVDLDPGVYTAIVSGVGDTTGVALVELYTVD